MRQGRAASQSWETRRTAAFVRQVVRAAFAAVVALGLVGSAALAQQADSPQTVQERHAAVQQEMQELSAGAAACADDTCRQAIQLQLADLQRQADTLQQLIAAQSGAADEGAASESEAEPLPQVSPGQDPQVVAKCVTTLASVDVTPGHQLYAPWMELCYKTEAAGGTFTVRPAHSP